MSLRTWSKRVVQGLLGVVLLVASAWVTSRLLGPTDAQEAALATMRELPPLEGGDAFGALWLMSYELSESERARVLAEDLRRLTAMPPTRDRKIDPTTPYASSAEGRFRKQSPSVEDMALFCGGGRDCLPVVEADPQRYAALVERHAAIIERAEALSAYSMIHHPRAAGLLDTVIPPYQHAKLPATRYAVDFLEGRRYEAFERTCRGIDTWRRLGANSDTLITRLIGAAYSVDVYGRLFVEMLARAPRDFELPPTCAQAFMPPSGDELSMCRAMQGELFFLVSATRQLESAGSEDMSSLERALMPVLFSAGMTEAERAEHLAFYCGEEAQRAMRTDRRIVRPEAEPDLLRFECVGNPVGCLLSSIANPGFDNYNGRIQDANARLRLIAGLIRLRADTRDQRPFDVRLRSAAGNVDGSGRDAGIGPDGHSLRVRNYDSWRSEYWEIPLPAYFHASEAAASR
ncbi:MAG: hypothetical protein ABL934_12320 [Lysobacteraceae bacterium]